MDTIASVVELVRDNEEMTKTLDFYESWFEGLVGRTMTVSQKTKNKTLYSTCVIEEFCPGEGWLAAPHRSHKMPAFWFAHQTYSNTDL